MTEKIEIGKVMDEYIEIHNRLKALDKPIRARINEIYERYREAQGVTRESYFYRPPRDFHRLEWEEETNGICWDWCGSCGDGGTECVPILFIRSDDALDEYIKQKEKEKYAEREAREKVEYSRLNKKFEEE